ncbi:esterase of the alpha-beta hydrolase superfamily [Candidatus Omnitrophus magneticus]|uniref:Esterase of the alpha-beta hydrolase superfamily n=1 Tax=Candidatus Omnitrophus magneticus TaxID=1609969 RepID=A0A0F0CQL3_9BACT|nr:esterase of the alpha-beta hydrolase superfamily [Candidatus Omnitrophus magneticus]
MFFWKKQKKVLVLGGGAARGLASIGVLKILERYGISDRHSFDLVVGTSIGSLIGAAYCAGKSLLELEHEAVQFKWPSLLDVAFSPTGILKGDKLEKVIVDMIGVKSFSDLSVPFVVATTDIETGEEVVHTSGDLIKLVRASCSWPGFFSSVNVDGRMLADGGIRNSVPTKIAYNLGASFVVAIDPGFGVKHEKMDNALKALVQSIQIMGEELNSYQTEDADIVIKPRLKNIDQFDFDKADFIIKQGELAAIEQLSVLRRRLS